MALGGAVRGLLIKNISGLDNIPKKAILSWRQTI